MRVISVEFDKAAKSRTAGSINSLMCLGPGLVEWQVSVVEVVRRCGWVAAEKD